MYWRGGGIKKWNDDEVSQSPLIYKRCLAAQNSFAHPHSFCPKSVIARSKVEFTHSFIDKLSDKQMVETKQRVSSHDRSAWSRTTHCLLMFAIIELQTSSIFLPRDRYLPKESLTYHYYIFLILVSWLLSVLIPFIPHMPSIRNAANG